MKVFTINSPQCYNDHICEILLGPDWVTTADFYKFKDDFEQQYIVTQKKLKE